MGLIEFAQYLDDDRNSIFDPQRRAPGAGGDLDRYMSFPLSHYWISSSHNTYLTSDQLQGVSSSDQYTYVLQNGCRCVELDCWDGEKAVPPGNPGDEPVITHGHTMCTKIFFRDVIRTLKTRAFGPPANNPYPVILSIEMHCSAKFQDRMFEICEEEFGDKVLCPCGGFRLEGPYQSLICLLTRRLGAWMHLSLINRPPPLPNVLSAPSLQPSFPLAVSPPQYTLSQSRTRVGADSVPAGRLGLARGGAALARGAQGEDPLQGQGRREQGRGVGLGR